MNGLEGRMTPLDTRGPADNGDPRKVKKPVEARAGLISGHVITILIVGTILAIVLLAVAWAISGG